MGREDKMRFNNLVFICFIDLVPLAGVVINFGRDLKEKITTGN